MIELLFEKNQICEEEEYNGYASRDCYFFQFQSTKNPTTCFRTQKKTITNPMKTKVNKPIPTPMMAELERDIENISIQKNCLFSKIMAIARDLVDEMHRLSAFSCFFPSMYVSSFLSTTYTTNKKKWLAQKNVDMA